MPETSTELLLECLVESLHTFAFIAAEPPAGRIPAPADADLYTLRFHGAFSGELQLAAPRASEVGHVRRLVHLGTDAVAGVFGHESVAGLLLLDKPTGARVQVVAPPSVSPTRRYKH